MINKNEYLLYYNILFDMLLNKISTKQSIFIWTDGSCLKNPGPGGWAYLLEQHNDNDIIEYTVSSNKQHSTNNQMELTAVIEALDFLNTNILKDNISSSITIYSDSNYTIKGITQWMHNWIRKNQTSRPNWSLWERLWNLNKLIEKNHQINYQWVRAHSDNQKNNIVDQLARERASEIVSIK
jgi:ribonuclease HI